MLLTPLVCPMFNYYYVWINLWCLLNVQGVTYSVGFNVCKYEEKGSLNLLLYTKKKLNFVLF